MTNKLNSAGRVNILMSYYNDLGHAHGPPPEYSSDDYMSSSGCYATPSDFSVGSWVDNLPPELSDFYPPDYIPSDFDIPNSRRRRHQNNRKYCFVWPKDGKNGTTLGRMRDIATGRGPDIFVVSSPDVNSRYGMPTRGQWTQWNEKYPWAPRFFPPRSAPWAQRNPHHRYDYRRRKYCIPDQMAWTNAFWPKTSRSNPRYPLAFQSFDDGMQYLR